VRELCEAAVDAALGAGASYADARAVTRRSQSVATKNGRVDGVNDSESEGIGVRVLVGGAWGFASAGRLDASGAREAALRACAFARVAPGGHGRALAPVEARSGTYRTPVEIDPFGISIADKVAHCLAADAAMRHDGVTITEAFVRAQSEHKFFCSSDGAAIEQELVECGAGIDALAVGGGSSQVRSYPSAHSGSSRPPRSANPCVPSSTR